MEAGPTRDTCDIRIESRELPCDRLQVRTLSGREAISTLYAFELTIVCLDREGVPVSTLVGAEITVLIEHDGRELRRVHGMIVEVTDRFVEQASVRAYRVRVAPRAHRLTMIEMHDIFMDISVPDLIARKLSLLGLSKHTEMRLLESYPERDFIVQYGETDLALVSRLAEHLGISFFFEHGRDHATLVFTDHAAGFRLDEEAADAAFRERGEQRDVFEIEATTRVVPAFYVMRDFNYRTPHVDLTAYHALEEGHPGGVLELGAHYKTPEEGTALARVRAEERLATQLVYDGRSALPGLAAGARLRLHEHPDLGPVDLLVIAVEHEARQVVASSAGENFGYVNRFRAMPAERTYRPPRRTPRPRISGLLTGVIDPGSTGIDSYAQLDDQGRYRVRFFFDSTPPGERLSSKPVRMLHAHVGEHYGAHFPLKPGAEVLVGFLGGDPDRPIIVGAAHNPLAPSTVTDRNPMTHRIRTATGITIDLVDEP